MLAATLIVFAFGNLLAVLAPGYSVVAGRIAQGAALLVPVSIGSAAVAAMAGPGQEGRAVGLVYLGVVVANVIAVPAGVVIADGARWALSFAVLAILSAFAALVVDFSFPRGDAAGWPSAGAGFRIVPEHLSMQSRPCPRRNCRMDGR